MTIDTATTNYQNAKQFLSLANSIHALNHLRGAALKQCAKCRRELINLIIERELR